MHSSISQDNPFGVSPHALVWEFIKKHGGSKRHLDYGTHDGFVLEKLAETGLVVDGFGVDLNVSSIERGKATCQNGRVTLRVIRKGEPLPFQPEEFDTVSILGVIEHVADQKGLLQKLLLVLKPGGELIVLVPGKHFFSFLDIGNFKFNFPRLHRWLYCATRGRAEYEERFVQCANGLYGDIELEKMWHEHFTHESLSTLLQSVGFEVHVQDGMGFFFRIIRLARHLSPSWLSNMLIPLENWDLVTFSQAEIFCVGRKPPESI